MAKLYKLSFSGKIAVTLALGYISAQPAIANIQSANSNTQIVRVKNVEVVNIASPTVAGLSHNQYNNFNVERSGAVLNNAVKNGTSQLAGDLARNPNLKTQAATVILNEVVSRNPSVLAGKQEVFGQAADYVLANPNGIACDGCGFINTPRASLVVGTPTVNEGKLTQYHVNGDKQLSTKGKIVNQNVETVDLIAPTVSINGEIKGNQDINVIIGRNTVDIDHNKNFSVQTLPQTKPVLDGRVMGSIQAGRIRIHSTDARATVVMTGANINADAVAVTSGNTRIEGKLTTNTKKNGKNYIANKKVAVNEFQNDQQQTYQETVIHADEVTFTTQHNFHSEGVDIKAKNVSLDNGSTYLGSKVTAHQKTQRKHQSKGNWYRNEKSSQHEETVHRTTIEANNINIASNKGQIKGEGAKFITHNLILNSEKNIEFSGQKSINKYTESADFRRESAKLKTGRSYQSGFEEHYTPSEFYVKDMLLINGKSDLKLKGVIGAIDGNTAINTKGVVEFGAEQTHANSFVDDKEKYWGGLVGAKSLAVDKNQSVHFGSDFTTKETMIVNAGKGVNILGSRVLANQGFVALANDGKMVIDSVQNIDTSLEANRIGTIFNITKSRQNQYKFTSTNQSSVVKSEANLAVASNKAVNVIGSLLEAAGDIEIDADKINIIGKANQHYTHSSEAGFGFTHKIDKPKVSFDYKNNLVKTAISLVKGETKLADALKDRLSFSASGNGALNIYNRENQIDEIHYTPSTINGGNVDISSNTVNIAGSHIQAGAGNIKIDAHNVITNAQIESISETKKQTEATITLAGKASENGISANLGLNIEHQNGKQLAQSIQSSSLSAKNDVVVNANTVNHYGTQINAGNNIIHSAESIHNDVATAKENEQNNYFSFGIDSSIALGKDKALSFGVSAKAEGGKSQSESTSVQGTSLNAKNHIISTSAQLMDVATHYQAGQNVKLDSTEHRIESAYGTQSSHNFVAGVNIGVTGSTNDFQTVNLNTNVGAKYQQNSSADTTAVKPTISAHNIEINTGNLHSQADFIATENIGINATGNVNLSQSTNTKHKSGGGFDVNVGVGGIVAPAAGVVIPSIQTAVNVNGNKGVAHTAVTNTISGHNVLINSQNNTKLQGTNIEANHIEVNANHIVVNPAENHIKTTAVNVGGSVALGSELSNIGLSGKLSVGHENSNSHTSSHINGESLALNAQNGVILTAVNSQTDQITLNTGKGDLTISSAPDHNKKIAIDMAIDLNGKTHDKQWVPDNGGAILSVEVVNNQVHQSSRLNAQNAHLQVGGDASFNGSAIVATHVDGVIEGNQYNQDTLNKINESKVALSATASGKLQLPTEPANIIASIKNDYKNGTIAGVKGDAEVELAIQSTETAVNAGIQTAQNETQLVGKLNHNPVVAKKPTTINYTGHINTNHKQNLKNFLNKSASKLGLTKKYNK